MFCLLYIIRKCEHFEEAIHYNLSIGGDVDLRAPLIGSFYAASVYPFSNGIHSWSNVAIPVKWLRMISDEVLDTCLDFSRKVHESSFRAEISADPDLKAKSVNSRCRW